MKKIEGFITNKIGRDSEHSKLFYLPIDGDTSMFRPDSFSPALLLIGDEEPLEVKTIEEVKAILRDVQATLSPEDDKYFEAAIAKHNIIL